MENNVFGNLMDWGAVLEKLERLSRTGELGYCQDELIRLLRFDHNWRLREAAIEALPFVENPGLDLAQEVLLVIKRRDLYYDIRILATDSFEKMARAMVKNPDIDKDQLQAFFTAAIKDLNALLSSPEPPIFYTALQQCAGQIKKTASDL
ncbi:MAG: hypothetical protein V2J08_01935 [Desulfotignum sp.]|jgi:hypothetical protein|nr:hypothetical protein [Desulfotignum sp.]